MTYLPAMFFPGLGFIEYNCDRVKLVSPSSMSRRYVDTQLSLETFLFLSFHVTGSQQLLTMVGVDNVTVSAGA